MDFTVWFTPGEKKGKNENTYTLITKFPQKNEKEKKSLGLNYKIASEKKRGGKKGEHFLDFNHKIALENKEKKEREKTENTSCTLITKLPQKKKENTSWTLITKLPLGKKKKNKRERTLLGLNHKIASEKNEREKKENTS